uniref:(California timema) hypothetical protein n=1 Tax=Timema californicum TaxID=61474 RepID=A0A7R9PB15_TIMCA|nr:unnamed protein product [Timema californicum]
MALLAVLEPTAVGISAKCKAHLDCSADDGEVGIRSLIRCTENLLAVLEPTAVGISAKCKAHLDCSADDGEVGIRSLISVEVMWTHDVLISTLPHVHTTGQHEVECALLDEQTTSTLETGHRLGSVAAPMMDVWDTTDICDSPGLLCPQRYNTRSSDTMRSRNVLDTCPAKSEVSFALLAIFIWCISSERGRGRGVRGETGVENSRPGISVTWKRHTSFIATPVTTWRWPGQLARALGRDHVYTQSRVAGHGRLSVWIEHGEMAHVSNSAPFNIAYPPPTESAWTYNPPERDTAFN